MAETTLSVRQIIDLGLWEKVCDYKGWSEWIYNEGRIDGDELVTFDSEFKKEDEVELDTSHELAEFLHSELCTSNHADDCPWFYEGDDWTSYAHKKYLNKAIKMLDTNVDFEDIKTIIKIATGY